MQKRRLAAAALDIAIFVEILVAIVAATSLLVDYLRPAPVFCSALSGCDELKKSEYAALFGVPLPALGLAGLVVLLGLWFFTAKRARQAFALVGAVGAVAAGYLLSVQFKLETFCSFCITVDTCAILIGTMGVSRALLAEPWERPRRLSIGMVAGALVLAGATYVWGSHRKAKVPDPIEAILDASEQDGKIVVIDFIDLECPYCRLNHVFMDMELKRHADRIVVVTKHVPLPMHPHARDAAIAAVCAGDKERQAVDRIAGMPPAALTKERLRDAVVDLGVARSAYDKCLSAPETTQRIEGDVRAFRESGGRGLPTVWIDRVPLEGAQKPAQIRATLEAALAD